MTAILGDMPVENPAESPAVQGDYRFDDSVGFLLGRLKGRMGAQLDAELKALDIRAPQWVVLMRIANGYARTSAELCRAFNYDTGSMTRMLDRLEEKGLIQRERSQEDRRIVTLALTEAGLALYPQLLRAGQRVAERLVSGISPEALAQFKALALQMYANLEEPTA